LRWTNGCGWQKTFVGRQPATPFELAGWPMIDSCPCNAFPGAVSCCRLE
jgi:hypothetical protein